MLGVKFTVMLRARAVLKERWLPVSARALAGPALWHAGVGPVAACLVMAYATVPCFFPTTSRGALLFRWRDVICIRSIADFGHPHIHIFYV